MTSERIRIATDSVCDLPRDLAAALNVKIIPTYVNIGDESIPDDGFALNRAQFYRDLPAMTRQPTTAAPSPGDAEAFYRSMLMEDTDHIISIHVPERLSGVLNVMRLGAHAVGPDKITLVDSMQLTFGMGLQVWIAAELARHGASRKRILASVEQVRRYTRVYAVINTIEYLKRSGRVNPLVASLGELLRIKPIINVSDGEVTSIGRQRTWKRAVARLQELTRAQSPLERLAILYSGNRHAADNFLDSIRDIAPSDTLVLETTPTLGTHIGPDALGVATLSRNWRL